MNRSQVEPTPRLISENTELPTAVYATTRAEVWSWYWAMWRAVLWRYHLFIVVSITAFLLLILPADLPNRNLKIFAILLITLVCAILYPQLRYKPQTRIVQVTKDGVYTKIRGRAKTITWQDVAHVKDNGQMIVIQLKSKNALLIPERAFDDDSKRKAFSEYAATALKQA